MMILNRKRNILYILIIILFIGAVVQKRGVVSDKRSGEIISVVSCWKADGKPVTLKRLEKRDVNLFTKVTMSIARDGYYEAYVPRTMQEKFEAGQEVFLESKGDVPVGKLTEIAQEIDMNTGMFHAEAEIFEDAGISDKALVLCVHTSTIKDVICVPNEVLVYEGGNTFIWTASDDKARKRQVTVGVRDGYGAVIESGLTEGDAVIVQGYTQLVEGDNIDILNTKESNRK